MKIFSSDCLKVLKTMESNSIDSIVSDPPYGIAMDMGKDWDQELPSDLIWKECFRVLRPGGYILAFSSARLYHHLAISMEEVGFDTQNMLAWIYGGGFPKGVNLSLQFDKNGNLPKPDDKFRKYLKSAINESSYKIKDLEEMCGTFGMFSHYLGKSQPAFPSLQNWKILKKALKLDDTYDSLFEEIEKRRIEFKTSKTGESKGRHFEGIMKDFKRHEAKSELAKKWEGWRYGKMALRPCIEPIYFGQKPPIRPVIENVKLHEVGALNIDGCKVEGRDGVIRTPTNIMHDGSENVVNLLERESKVASSTLNEFNFNVEIENPFFFVPKPMGKERKGNLHPTVKPISLMSQLVKLVTPPNGTCLDPFMGSGTTGVACAMEGVDFIGIEREKEYYEIAKRRLGELYSNVA